MIIRGGCLIRVAMRSGMVVSRERDSPHDHLPLWMIGAVHRKGFGGGLLSESWATLAIMMGDARAALDALCGPLLPDPVADQAADRAVRILHAHAAALTWVRQATGSYPAPLEVAGRLAEVATQLRGDDRDPVAVLIGVAAVAVAEYQATTAA
jgi:hypothetical protein